MSTVPGPNGPTYAEDRETSTTGQAKDKAREAAGVAQEKAQEAKSRAGDRVREQVDQRSTQAGERVSTAAGDARSVGEELRRQGKEGPARLADQAAERVERLGGYLQRSDADRILGDVEDFARRRPWAVAAGGVTAGFLLSRVLKASSTDRYRTRQSAGEPPSPRPERPAVTGEIPVTGPPATPAGAYEPLR
jgi:hypothetical protein